VLFQFTADAVFFILAMIIAAYICQDLMTIMNIPCLEQLVGLLLLKLCNQ